MRVIRRPLRSARLIVAVAIALAGFGFAFALAVPAQAAQGGLSATAVSNCTPTDSAPGTLQDAVNPFDDTAVCAAGTTKAQYTYEAAFAGAGLLVLGAGVVVYRKRRRPPTSGRPNRRVRTA